MFSRPYMDCTLDTNGASLFLSGDAIEATARTITTGNLTVDVTDLVVPGENTLTLRVARLIQKELARRLSTDGGQSMMITS